MNQGKLQVHVKVWLANEGGEAVFGLGLLRLLQGVEQTGSLLQAASALDMSYRSAWGRLKTAERRLGEALLERTPGAGRHGGSRLTPTGRRLLERYGTLVEQITRSSEAAFGRLFLIDD
jgi:molybdate transport system regulatory protein